MCKPDVIDYDVYTGATHLPTDQDYYWWEPPNRLVYIPSVDLLQWSWVAIPYEKVEWMDVEIVAFLRGLKGRWTYFDVQHVDGGAISRFCFERPEDAVQFKLVWG
jgi:hypothetical protein